MLKNHRINKQLEVSNFNTPILFITFNRPVHTKKVFEAIRQQKPYYLYVFQDGPRGGITNDFEKCMAVRSILSEEIDWNCELKTFFSDVNLGCGSGPVTAISWFFENIEQGIILEDDCLPHPDFFPFCEELLNRYKNNKQIMVVGTTTYHDNYPCRDSYLFSKYFTGGAWATWRRAWNGYSFDLENMNEELFKKNIQKQFYSSAETNWWLRKLKQIKTETNEKDYWDYQMQIHLLQNNGIAIRPQKNMISNIGFDPEGTHTLENDNRGNREVYLCFPLNHPLKIEINKKNDYLYMSKELQKRIDKRILSLLYNYILESDGVLNKLLSYYKQKKLRWKINTGL